MVDIILNSAMEYQMIPGVREGSRLLYVPSENMLYTYKIERNDVKVYICYQQILSAKTKDPRKRLGIDQTDCTARVRVINEHLCESMGAEHTCHTNHHSVAQDLKTRDAIKRNCRKARNEFEGDAHRIPTRHIFQREIVK